MRKRIGWLTLLLLLIFGIFLSLTVGTIPLGLNDLLHVFQRTASTSQQLIVFDFRFPRLLVSILAGMGLAVSGYLFQTITHNDLADPGILGINAGAGLTVLIYLGFFCHRGKQLVFATNRLCRQFYCHWIGLLFWPPIETNYT